MYIVYNLIMKNGFTIVFLMLTNLIKKPHIKVNYKVVFNLTYIN